MVEQTIRLANAFGVPVTLLCDTSHEMDRKGAHTITVSKGADSVDFALVNLVKAGDIVVTQDYGLAAMCLAKQAVPLHQDGFVYSDENIDSLLLARHTAKKIRQSGGRLKGSAKRTQAKNAAFEQVLTSLLGQTR